MNASDPRFEGADDRCDPRIVDLADGEPFMSLVCHACGWEYEVFVGSASKRDRERTARLFMARHRRETEIVRRLLGEDDRT